MCSMSTLPISSNTFLMFARFDPPLMNAGYMYAPAYSSYHGSFLTVLSATTYTSILGLRDFSDAISILVYSAIPQCVGGYVEIKATLISALLIYFSGVC